MQKGWPAGSAKTRNGGVGEDPEARFVSTRDTGGTQGEQVPLRLVGITDADVQVHLLRIRRVGPAWRNPAGSALEGQLPQARPGTDDHPAADVFVDAHPQHLAVELGKSTRVGAVDHSLFEASDHTESMSTCPRQPLPLIGYSCGRR
jgi:hypothetical protein